MLFLDCWIVLPTMPHELAELDGTMNLIGVSLICSAQAYFIVQVTDGVHRKLNSVNGDGDMFETVFRNLISNAAKYSKENGEVQITA